MQNQCPACSFQSCCCRTAGKVHGHHSTQWSLPPVGLGDKHFTRRLRSVRSSLQPIGEILEIVLEGLAVVPPRLATSRSYDSFIHYTSPVLTGAQGEPE